MNLQPFTETEFAHFRNANYLSGADYPPSFCEVISLRDAAAAVADIQSWRGYSPTPLSPLDEFGEALKVRAVFYKDESKRFGLGSFKALGGAFAVCDILKNKASQQGRKKINGDALLDGDYFNITKNITVACATDGNHGRAVAWGAKRFGCKCKIYIHKYVSDKRQTAMEKLGATVVRINGNYDESVKVAAAAAAKNGWIVVSDTSYPGYVDIPKKVMAGYCVMVDEALSQLSRPPTHVFVQGGVGGLAAAVCAYLRQKRIQPRFVVVEPALADCLYRSAVNQKPTTVDIKKETMMAGLSCGEVSLLAWQILQTGASDFLTITDDLIPPLMRMLNRRRPQIIAGESATAGLAGFVAAACRPKIARRLDINPKSEVLVFGTEGATDETIYDKIINA